VVATSLFEDNVVNISNLCTTSTLMNFSDGNKGHSRALVVRVCCEVADISIKAFRRSSATYSLTRTHQGC